MVILTQIIVNGMTHSKGANSMDTSFDHFINNTLPTIVKPEAALSVLFCTYNYIHRVPAGVREYKQERLFINVYYGLPNNAPTDKFDIAFVYLGQHFMEVTEYVKKLKYNTPALFLVACNCTPGIKKGITRIQDLEGLIMEKDCGGSSTMANIYHALISARNQK